MPNEPPTIPVGGFVVEVTLPPEFAYRDEDQQPLLTVTEAASMMGVTVAAVCHWARTGFRWPVGQDANGKPLYERRVIEPAGLDRHGRKLYRLQDVADAEWACRGRGRPRTVAA